MTEPAGQLRTRALPRPFPAERGEVRHVTGAKLKEHFAILGRERLQPVVLVGAGNLGSALLRYQGFQKEGFEVICAFDADPDAGVLSVGGRMLDRPHLVQARRVLERARERS